MPIKSTVVIQADEAKFKKTYAAFEKYRAALKETHGVYVLQAPHVRAASAVGDDLAKFVNGIDHAARSQTSFATAADKAHHAFRGLAGGVVHTLESFARVALSPLQLLFPAGLSVGLLGLGAGLVGAGVAGATLYGLDRAASGVSDRRRRALGLGVDYGAPTAFDLNFARFGAEGGLESVAAGAYDVASFDAALSRAGQKIESALGRNLVALTPGLIKFSDDIKNFIDALVDSGAVTDALKGIQGGLQWFERCVGSSSFKRDSSAFLEGLDKLGTVAGPALLTLMQIEGALGLVGLGGLSKALKRVTINGATFWVIGKFAEDALTGKLFEPTTGANRRLAQDLGLEPRGDSSYAPGRRSDGLGGSSIRYYAGRGKERPPYGGVIDSATGKLLPRPSFKYSPSGRRGWNASVGDIPPDVLAQVQADNPQLTPRQCVELIQSTMGVGNVHDWRRGPSEKDSPEGAALATFGVHGDSNLYAYGGSGTPGIGRDHALKLVKKYPDGSFDAISQDIGHAPHLIHMPYTGTGGEGDASSGSNLTFESWLGFPMRA